jgi:hypothetical protein
MSRIVCRFSCGAPSAVAAKLTLAKYGHDRVEITYSDTRSEHEDNARFLADCEAWFGKKVSVLASTKYRDIWDVFERERFIMSKAGGQCAGALKREPFYAFQLPTDTLVFGYTAEPYEQQRAARLAEQNFETKFEFPLIAGNLSKADCKSMVMRAGIALPKMYDLGFNNNNCVGCPKGGMGYWNHIRKHFPEQFERMAALQRKLGPGSAFLKRGGGRITLDDLPLDAGNHSAEAAIECSLMCVLAEQDINDLPATQQDQGA